VSDCEISIHVNAESKKCHVKGIFNYCLQKILNELNVSSNHTKVWILTFLFVSVLAYFALTFPIVVGKLSYVDVLLLLLLLLRVWM
jgi:hypothetical protein